MELYYIFSTLWGREQYTLYGILLVVFLILLSVTASISIALTYFQLSAEDYRWWWRSVISAGYAFFNFHLIPFIPFYLVLMNVSFSTDQAIPLIRNIPFIAEINI